MEKSKEILKLHEPITVEAIKTAYTEELSKCYPDFFDSNILKSLAVKQLSKINKAYKSLMKRYGKENLRGSISYYQAEIKYMTKSRYYEHVELFAWGEALGWLTSGLPKGVQNIIHFPLVGYPLACLMMVLSLASLIHKFLFNIIFAILSKIPKKDFQQYHPINPTLSLILNIMAIVIYITLLLVTYLIDKDNHLFIVILTVIIIMVFWETVFNLRLIFGNKLKNIKTEVDLFLGL